VPDVFHGQLNFDKINGLVIEKTVYNDKNGIPPLRKQLHEFKVPPVSAGADLVQQKNAENGHCLSFEFPAYNSLFRN
jgi:hypothetical protein